SFWVRRGNTTPDPDEPTGQLLGPVRPREDRTRLSGVTGLRPAPLIPYAPPPIRSAGAIDASASMPHNKLRAGGHGPPGCDWFLPPPSQCQPVATQSPRAPANFGWGSSRHGTPSRSIAQHRTRILRANATTAGFFLACPPPVSRLY